MKATPLERVTEAAIEHRGTTVNLASAIRKARKSGLSLRAIGEAAGLSHEQIRRMSR